MRVACAVALLAILASGPGTSLAQEGVFLSEDEAPHAVFPDADRFVRREIEATPELRQRAKERLGSVTPSHWEAHWITFDAFAGEKSLGRAILVEEIGKHRPITFVVGVTPEHRVADVAVVAYREAYGGEIHNKRFLTQYHNKSATDSLKPYEAIKNIAGATLSVEAASRAVKKALAIAEITETAP